MRRTTEGFWRRLHRRPLAERIAIAVLLMIVAVIIVAAIASATRTDSSSDQSTPSTPSQSSGKLVPLRIAAPSHAGSYKREAGFGGWTSVNGCRDTRAALLIRTSAAPVAYTGSSQCTVKSGRWTDPWSGVTTTIARALHLDHTVPLANAWRSGAWAWTHEQRVAYANDLADAMHLVPIVAAENESKGDNGPDEWRPPNQSTWCEYAIAWDRIKAKWHLSATPTEWRALVEMAATC